MTPDRVTELLQYQRPGISYVVGPVQAEERYIAPLPSHKVDALPGEHCWIERDFKKAFNRSPTRLEYLRERERKALST